MKCLVCDHTIRIDTLKQLFATSTLLLCQRCEQNLIPKQGIFSLRVMNGSAMLLKS